MKEQHFNLLSEPWIKVIDAQNNQEITVSLQDVFRNAPNYRQLAGDMRSQDLAILRFLLAILTTVYSRVDSKGKEYTWLKRDSTSGCLLLKERADLEDIKEQLLATWKELYEQGHFTSAVGEYLEAYRDRFDMFGETPFYQVPRDVYDSVATKKVATGKGTVAVKQINRLISESNNSPAIFAPRVGTSKNNMMIPELVRWLIMYQNFTGVTDKTKVDVKEKYSVSSGWLYGIDPVLVKGDTLFETLLLNLILYPDKETEILQYPVWEFEDIAEYIKLRLKGLPPSNLSELYTVWARIIYIEREKAGFKIFACGLPKIDNANAFIEPMTTWKYDHKEREFKPRTKWIKSIGKSMWRNFGQYVGIEDTEGTAGSEPGIVKWLNHLKNEEILPSGKLLHLQTIGMISDGNATSQSPVAEVCDDLLIRAGVLFDHNEDHAPSCWPVRIEATIQLTQNVGEAFWRFGRNWALLRGLGDGASGFANSVIARYYDRLNKLFRDWLASLRVEQEPDEEIVRWKQILQRQTDMLREELLQSATPQDMCGKKEREGTLSKNIFLLNNQLQRNIRRLLA